MQPGGIGNTCSRMKMTFSALRVLLKYLLPMMTIPSIHPSHPIRHIALNELNRPKIDLS